MIRAYQSSDCAAILSLFYDTVHTINAKDYELHQLDAWASGKEDSAAWDQSLSQHHALVALRNGILVGFGDIDQTGYLDRLFIHKDFQRQGIATELCDALESMVPNQKIWTEASVTAKPFFENRGYRVIRTQWVERHGVLLMNYVMEKTPFKSLH